MIDLKHVASIARKLLWTSCLLAIATLTGIAQTLEMTEHRLGLRFEPTTTGGTFMARSSGYDVVLNRRGASIRTSGGEELRMHLLGAAEAALAGELPITAKFHDFRGADSSLWRRDYRAFETVRASAAYPGIDVLYYGKEGRLEYDFVVAPGVDPAVIRLEFEGVRKVEVNAGGDLLLFPHGSGREPLRQHRPVAFQWIAGRQVEVAARFVLHKENVVTFSLGDYDLNLELVIDPVLSYAGYLGGTGRDTGEAITSDASGNLYVTGRTASEDIAGVDALRLYSGDDGQLLSQKGDAYVAKFLPSGDLDYFTYLGGSRGEGGVSLSADAEGRVYVTGTTESEDFPVTADAFAASLGGVTGEVIFHSTDGGTTWTARDRGLTVSEANAFAAHPTASGTIYAATPGGVYRTDDGGLSWRNTSGDVREAHPLEPPEAISVAVDPRAPETVYFGTEDYLYRSTDGGANWQQLVGGGYPQFAAAREIVVDANDSLTLHVATEVGVYRTTDGGASWSASTVAVSLVVIGLVAVDPNSPERVFAEVDDPFADSEDRGLFVSGNGAGTWSKVLGGLPDDQPIHAIAFAPDAIFASTRTLYKSTDDGVTWNSVGTGLPDDDIYALAIDPSNASKMLAGTSEGAYRSVDGGATWVPSNTGMNDDVVYAIAYDPSDPLRVHAGTRFGMNVSSDGGLTWSGPTTAPTGDFFTTVAVNPANPDIVYAGGNDGVFKSTDAGATWAAANNGFGDLAPSIDDIVIDPENPDTVYANNGTYNPETEALEGIFKTTDGGASWVPVNTGLDNTYVNSLAIDPVSPNTLYAGTDDFLIVPGQSSGVYKTVDGGANWRLVNVGLPVAGQSGQTAGATALAQDPRDPAVLYAASGGEGILKSLDGGLSYIAAFSTSDEIRGFVFDPADSGGIYAATDFGVWFSDDGGATFEPRNTGLDGLDVRELKFVGGTFFAATDRGLYRSDNGGGNWSLVDAPGLTEQDMRALGLTADGALYAAARTQLNRGLLADAFIAELAPDGSLAWASYFGGGGADAGLGIAVVGGGGFCVTGQTSSAEFFPLKNAIQSELAGATDAFVARFAADRSLVHSTYLGGSDDEASFRSSNGNDFRIESFGAVATLPDGSAAVTGLTRSVDFPVTAGAFSQDFQGVSPDAYVTVIAPEGGTLTYSTYYGGTSPIGSAPLDTGTGIAVDASGLLVVVGETHSADLPVRDGFQPNYAGSEFFRGDAFVAKFDPSKSGDASLVFASYLGGAGDDSASGVAIDSSGNILITGMTGSAGFPTTAGAFRQRPLSGILLSTDRGTTFAPFNNGLPSYSVHELAVAPSATNRIYAALSGGNYSRTEALARGMFRSDDGGASWLEINNGLTSPMVNAIAIDPANEDTVLVATGVTAFEGAASGTVFRSTDGGESWDAPAGGLPGGLKFNVLAVAPGGMTVLVGGNDNRGEEEVPRMFRSTDGGANWEAATSGLGDGIPTSVVFDPADPAIIYAALRGRSDGNFPDPTHFPGGVFKSTNGGATWAAMNENIVGRPEETIQSVENLAVDPIEAETLYVLASFEPETLGQVVALRSTDGGASWTVGGDTPSLYALGINLAVSAEGSHLHAATRDHVFFSPDGGTTWTELGATGHEGYEYTNVVADPVDPNKVYLVTEGSSGGGVRDAFLAKIAPDGSTLTFSSLLGGARSDLGKGVTATGSDQAAVVGMTLSYDIPTTPGGFGQSFSGGTGIDVGTSHLSVRSDAFIISADLTSPTSEIGNVMIVRAPHVFSDVEEVTPVVAEVTFDSSSIPAPITQAEVDAALVDANPGEQVLVRSIVERVEDETRIDDTIETIETNGAVFGVDYTGNPDDPESWVALTQSDITVNIATTIERTLFFTETTTNYFVIAPGVPNGADLVVTQTAAPDLAIVGVDLTYTITIENKGPEAATGVKVSDVLPEMADFVSATDDMEPASGVVTFTADTLPAGSINVFQIVVRPRNAGAATLTNLVSVTAEQTDPVESNNSATMITPVFRTDTDPNIGLLRIVSIRVNADESVTIRFLSESGTVYHLEYSDDLSEFIRITPPITATSSVSEINDAGPPLTPVAPSGKVRRFYRIAEDD